MRSEIQVCLTSLPTLLTLEFKDTLARGGLNLHQLLSINGRPLPP